MLATDVEGIFRLAGSEKRIKELRNQFDSPDRYGKGLDWTGYTVHDAANILRRYFNQLPEPIIPLDFYDRFRDPLRNHQAQAVGQMDAQSPSVGEFHHDGTIRRYQNLITELPPLNRQLLLYILDLLAVFASKSDLNKMTTQNLSAIFQPGTLSHPQHDMAPPEYRLSQDVLIFLIDNQDSFLIGMQGTAADSETVREVQSGVPSPTRTPSTPTTPGRAKTVVGRSTSNASVGADSVRKWGSIRRNVSVTSKNSKKSERGPTPVTPAVNSPLTPSNSGNVHRSNTVPSRRGNGSAQASPRFSREKNSDPTTPNATTIAVAEAVRPKQESLQSTPTATSAPQFPRSLDSKSIPSSEATTPLAAAGSETSSAVRSDFQTPKKDTTPLLSPPGGSGEAPLERSASNTPSMAPRGFLDIFKQSPGSEGEVRKPNKLRKKQYPSSNLSSAHSSSHSLHEHDVPQRSPITPGFAPLYTNERSAHRSADQSAYATAQTTPTGLPAPQSPPQRSITDATVKPTLSPAHSIHSTDDNSEAEMGGDELPKELPTSPGKKEKRHRWRFSRTQNKLEQPAPPAANPFGTKENAMSRSTVGSSNFSASASQPRKSFQEPTPLSPSATEPKSGSPQQTIASASITPSSTDPMVFSDSEREKRGPMSWLKGKIQERKEKDDAKRSATPERQSRQGGSRQDLGQLPPQGDGAGLAMRGKSFEVPRAAPAPPTNVESQRPTTGPGMLSGSEAPRAPSNADPSPGAAPGSADARQRTPSGPLSESERQRAPGNTSAPSQTSTTGLAESRDVAPQASAQQQGQAPVQQQYYSQTSGQQQTVQQHQPQVPVQQQPMQQQQVQAPAQQQAVQQQQQTQAPIQQQAAQQLPVQQQPSQQQDMAPIQQQRQSQAPEQRYDAPAAATVDDAARPGTATQATEDMAARAQAEGSQQQTQAPLEPPNTGTRGP